MAFTEMRQTWGQSLLRRAASITVSGGKPFQAQEAAELLLPPNP